VIVFFLVCDCYYVHLPFFMSLLWCTKVLGSNQTLIKLGDYEMGEGLPSIVYPRVWASFIESIHMVQTYVVLLI
jgi:hypothetical protein